MRTQMNLSISVELAERLRKEATMKRTKISYIVEEALRGILKLENAKYDILTCQICNAKYASKFDVCPNCIKIETELKMKETMKRTSDHAIERKKKLVEELQMYQDRNFVPMPNFDLEGNIKRIKDEIKTLNEIIGIS